MQYGKYGEGTVDTVRKMNYNKSADKKQYDKYKQIHFLMCIGTKKTGVSMKQNSNTERIENFEDKVYW